jgi:uncharacterized protein (DUF433 family)
VQTAVQASTNVCTRPSRATAGQTGGVTDDKLHDLISIDEAVFHGQPCIRGTRVLVTVVLDALAAGLSPADIVRDYPTIDESGVQAAVAYASWIAKQEIHARRLDA